MQIRTLLLSLSLSLSACGHGGSDVPFELFDGSTSEFRVAPDRAHLGDILSVQLSFEPASHNDEKGDNFADATEVVITLPAGVDFVADSSDVDGDITDGFEKRPPNTVEICNDGRRALTYHLASGELSDLVDSRIRLQARAFEVRGEVHFTADAARDLDRSCDVLGSESATITIVP